MKRRTNSYYAQTLIAFAALAAISIGCRSDLATGSSNWLHELFPDQTKSLGSTKESEVKATMRQKNELILVKATLQASDNHVVEAIRSYESILETDPDHAEVLHRLAILHAQLGDDVKAETRFRKALGLVDTNPQLHNDYGYFCYLHGETDAAVFHLRKAIELAPDSQEAHNNLGLVYGAMGLLQEAETEFVNAGGTRADVLNNLAFCRLMDSDLEAAATTYELSIRDNPDQKTAHRALASLHRLPRTAEGVTNSIPSVSDTPLHFGDHVLPSDGVVSASYISPY